MIEINYKLSLEEVAKIFSIEVAKETDANAWEKYTEKFSEIKKIENLYIEKSSLFSNFDFLSFNCFIIFFSFSFSEYSSR